MKRLIRKQRQADSPAQNAGQNAGSGATYITVPGDSSTGSPRSPNLMASPSLLRPFQWAHTQEIHTEYVSASTGSGDAFDFEAVGEPQSQNQSQSRPPTSTLSRTDGEGAEFADSAVSATVDTDDDGENDMFLDYYTGEAVKAPDAPPPVRKDSALVAKSAGAGAPQKEKDPVGGGIRRANAKHKPVERSSSLTSQTSLGSRGQALHMQQSDFEAYPPARPSRSTRSARSTSPVSVKSMKSAFSFEGPYRNASKRFYKPAPPATSPSAAMALGDVTSEPASVTDFSDFYDLYDHSYRELDEDDELESPDQGELHEPLGNDYWSQDRDTLAYTDEDYSIDDEMLAEANGFTPEEYEGPARPHGLGRSVSMFTTAPPRPDIGRQASLVVRKPDRVLTYFSPEPTPSPSRTMSTRTVLSRIDEA